MKTNISKIGLRPYDDNSGFREEVTATWERNADFIANAPADIAYLLGATKV